MQNKSEYLYRRSRYTCANCDNSVSDIQDYCAACLEKINLTKTINLQQAQIDNLTYMIQKLYLFIDKNFKDVPIYYNHDEPSYFRYDKYEKLIAYKK